MKAETKKRKSRIAALAIALELIALYRLAQTFRSIRANRKAMADADAPSAAR